MCLGIRGCKQHSGRLDKLKVDTLLVRVSATFGHVGNAASLSNVGRKSVQSQ